MSSIKLFTRLFNELSQFKYFFLIMASISWFYKLYPSLLQIGALEGLFDIQRGQNFSFKPFSPFALLYFLNSTHIFKSFILFAKF